MTQETYTKTPVAVRAKEDANDSGIGTRFVQWAAIDSDVTLYDVEGWHELGCQVGEIDYSSQVEYYNAAAGVPEVDLGQRKIGHKKAFTITLSYPEEKAIALVHGQNDITASYPDTPNATTVDTGTAPTTKTITVAVGTGSQYSAGDLIEFVGGSATYGTTKIYRYVESVATDTITVDRAIGAGSFPANGAAVNEVARLYTKEANNNLPDPIQLRMTENDNGRETIHLVRILKAQIGVGKYMAGDGKNEVQVQLDVTSIGLYNDTDGCYDILERAKIGTGTIT